MALVVDTPRLSFRTWTREDEELAVRLWSHPDVSRFTTAGGLLSRDEALERLRREMHNQATYGFQYWPMFARNGGALIGACGLKPYPAEPEVLEFGMQLLPEFWRQGYANEAGTAVIACAFARPDVRALFAGHHPDNAASAGMLRKLGFVYTHDEHFEPTGLSHCSYRLDAPRRVS